MPLVDVIHMVVPVDPGGAAVRGFEYLVEYTDGKTRCGVLEPDIEQGAFHVGITAVVLALPGLATVHRVHDNRVLAHGPAVLGVDKGHRVQLGAGIDLRLGPALSGVV